MMQRVPGGWKRNDSRAFKELYLLLKQMRCWNHLAGRSHTTGLHGIAHRSRRHGRQGARDVAVLFGRRGFIFQSTKLVFIVFELFLAKATNLPIWARFMRATMSNSGQCLPPLHLGR